MEEPNFDGLRNRVGPATFASHELEAARDDRQQNGDAGADARSRPLVMVTGHYGNFEIANYITGLFGLSTTAVARPLDNPFINDYFLRLRESKGQHMVSKDGSATDIDNHLKNNGVLTILADQYAGLKGCWVSFLGQPSSCHKSLALFTLIAGAPLLVVANRRVGRPMQFELDWFGTADPRQPGSHLDGMRELTGWYNERLAQAIARSPNSTGGCIVAGATSHLRSRPSWG